LFANLGQRLQKRKTKAGIGLIPSASFQRNFINSPISDLVGLINLLSKPRILKKILKRFFVGLALLLVLLSILALVSGRTYLFKAVAYNFADVDDYEIFDNNEDPNPGRSLPISIKSTFPRNCCRNWNLSGRLVW
jgi:hypothetical protein